MDEAAANNAMYGLYNWTWEDSATSGGSSSGGSTTGGFNGYVGDVPFDWLGGSAGALV